MFACFCSIDYDPPAVYTARIIKAAKEHHCIECGDVIKKGQRYEKVTGLWDGSWDTFKTCLICVAVRKDFTSQGDGCGFCHGSLWEDIRNAYDDAGYGPGEEDDEDDDSDPHDWLGV